MGILVDYEIRALAEAGMITPYEPQLVRAVNGKKIISYGQSSMGYDIRVADRFKVFTNALCAVVDPKNVDERAFVDVQADSILIPPNSYVLAFAVERLEIPDDVITLIIGKSSYARTGLIVNCTPGEPGWQGHLTIEISNSTPVPVKLYANEGVAQCLFFRGASKCETTYASRLGGAGKYQDQPPTIVLPRV